jgi:hypothetical protein
MKSSHIESISLFLVLTVIIVSGCITTDKPQPTSYSQVYRTPIITTEPTPSILKLSLGQTATTRDYAVTVFTATRTEQYRYYSEIFAQYSTETAEPGKTFLLIDAEIRYTGSESTYAGASDFSLEDSEGIRYDPEVVYLGNDDMGYFKELYPNQKVKGKILFIIPKYATGLKIYYNFGNLWTGTNLVYWDAESIIQTSPTTAASIGTQTSCGGSSFSSVLPLGQKFKYNDRNNANTLSLSVNFFRTADHYQEVKKDYTGKEYTEEITAMPGYKFLIVYVEATNTGHIGSSESYYSYYTSSPYAHDFVFYCNLPYSSRYLDTTGKIQYYQYSNSLYTYKSLNRYESTAGVIVFEIPTSIKPENGFILVQLWDPLEPVWRLS